MDITSFSDEQLAGQRLMVGFEGTRLNRELESFIGEIKVGGIILFARNIINPRQIRQLCMSIQEVAASCGQPPLFIAIDQEGGQVARLKEPFTQFPGNPKMKGIKDAEDFARTTAAELTEVGINMNLAPVLDIAFNGAISIMSDRAFGQDPMWVSNLGAAVIEHLQQSGIMAVAKHFPGIGRTTLDSHLALPYLDIDLDTLLNSDLVPFEAAIQHDVSAIMLSHILYQKLDPEWPASLSVTIAKNLLRERIGYNGVVLTDDLDMAAIKNHYDIKTVIPRILSADIDIALICHSRPDIEHAFEEICNALAASQSMKAKAKKSAERILKLKRKYLVDWSKG